MKDINEILAFIDSHTLDPHLYFQVMSLYDKEIRFEVQWTGDSKWRFKKVKEVFWTEVPTSLLVRTLSDEKVNLADFEVQARSKVLEQIVGAQFIVEAGRELMGDEVVDENIEAFRQFHLNMLSAIKQVLGEKKEKEVKEQKRSPLKVIKNEDGE